MIFALFSFVYSKILMSVLLNHVIQTQLAPTVLGVILVHVMKGIMMVMVSSV